MSDANPTFAVLGAGSWGTALALLLADNGHLTTLWAHSATHAKTLQQDRSNERYLPGVGFPAELKISSELSETIPAADIILLVIPSHAFRETLLKIKPHLQHRMWCLPGLEP